MENGTIRSIDTRGRVVVDLPTRRVVADIRTGGGYIGARVQGVMQPGQQIWRTPAGLELCVEVLAHAAA